MANGIQNERVNSGLQAYLLTHNREYWNAVSSVVRHRQ